VSDLVRENWSLPWHRLQKNLAREIRADAAGGFAAGRNAQQAQRIAHTASSWLVRARRPGADLSPPD
jgi:hypothetical protein